MTSPNCGDGKMSGLRKQPLTCLRRNCWVNCIHFDFLFIAAKARVMDQMALGYSHTVDTDFYEYRSDDFLPINVSVLDSDQEGAPFRPGSLVLDQLSSQGMGSQQSLLPQIFYRTSSEQSSLTSSQVGNITGTGKTVVSQSWVTWVWVWFPNSKPKATL